MKHWPPTMNDILATKPGTPFSAYTLKIWDELNTNPTTQDLSYSEKQTLCNTIVHLDSFAAAAFSRLKHPISALAVISPPPHIAKSKRACKQWEADKHDYDCICTAYKARSAIMAGNSIEALESAVDAGHFSRFRFAEIGWETSRHLTKAGSAANQSRAELHRATILNEGRELRLRQLALGKKYNIRTIAQDIESCHADEPGFPKFESIRKTLGADRSWESSA